MKNGLKTNLLFRIGCIISFAACFALSAVSSPQVIAATGINQTINFQGRLLNSQGATVPDGYYNIQFKIYQDGDGQSVGNSTGSPSGSLKWTENYLNDNSQGVQVVNGFLSVQLGSVNPFGSSIDWNEDTLWLSMNVGSTNLTCTPFSSCSPDGEMVPMQPLTAAPYAFNSKQLGGLTSSQFVQLAQGLQTDASSSTNSIYLNKTGSGNIIELQGSSTTVFTIGNTGDILSKHASTTALQVQNASSKNVLLVDTTNGVVALGNSGASGVTGTLKFNYSGQTGSVTLDANNPSSTAYTIHLPAENGTFCTTGSVCTGYQAAGNYANTGLSNLSSVAINTSLLGGSDNSIDIGNSSTNSFRTGYFDTSVLSASFDSQASNGALGLGNANAGAVTIGNSSNTTLTIKTKSSSAAFQLQNASSKNVLAADSTNGIVILGNSGSSGVTGTLKFNYSGSTGSISMVPLDPSSTAYTLNLPAEDGTVCTSGSICAGYASATGSFATPQLDNLSSVAINTSLLPGSDNSIDVGDSTTHSFRSGYYDTSVNSPSYTGSGAVTVASGGSSDLTLNSVSGTLKLGVSTSTLQFTNSGAAIINATSGQDLSLGTSASNHTTTVGTTNGTATTNISSGSGGIGLNGNTTVTSGNNFTVTSGTTTLTGTANFNTSGSATTTIGASSGTNLILQDADWGVTGAGAATFTSVSNSGDINFTSTTASTGSITKSFIVGGSGINQSDVVVMTTTPDVQQTTTARDTTVYGVSKTTTAAGNNATIVTSGNYTVNVDSGAVAIGDQLVTSTTAGRATVDNNATTGIIGIALSAKAGGANGTVSILVRPINGQYRPTFRASATSTTAFQVQSSGGVNYIALDTTINSLKLGITGSGSTNGVVHIGDSTAGIQTITIGSTNSSSITTIQSGSGGISLDGAVSIAGTNTFGTGTGQVSLNGNVITASGVSFTQNGGGTFTTGSGANTLSGDTTVSGTKNFTVNGGDTSLGGKLDVTKSAAFKRGTDFSTTGTTDNASFGDASLIRLTGGSAQTITGIANGRDGYVLTLVNTGVAAATLKNDDAGSSNGNKITTGTGASITIPVGGSVTLFYDAGASPAYWRVSGYSSNLQSAYLNSTSPQITLNSTNGGMVIQDASSPIGASLFTVQSNGGGTKYININSTTVAIADNVTVTGTYNTNTFNSTTLQFGGASGAISTSSGNLSITANGTSTLSLDTSGSGTISIAGTSSNATTVNIASNDVVHTLHIGDGGSSQTQTITIGSSGSTSSSVTLVAGSSSAINLNAATISTNASTLALFNTNAATVTVLQAATSVSFGATSGTLTVRNANQTFGNAAGSGVFTNNGATGYATLALGNLSAGSIGSAATTVDIYTSFSIAPTASGRAYTIPTPTSSTAYGRAIYISNIAATGNYFTIGGIRIPPGSTGTLIWSNTNGGDSWQFAGAGGASIENQNSADQSADFRINGTGQAAGFDGLASSSLAIGGTNATGVTIGNTTNTTTVTLQGAASASYVLGTSANTGGITVGNSTDTNTVSVGTGTTATGKTQTINIGTSATGTGKALVTIGNTNGASSVTLQGGSGGIVFTGATSVSGSNTFATGTGAVSLNGDTTVASSKNLVLGSSTSDLTCTSGAIFYRSDTNRFRGCENGTWIYIDNFADVQSYTSSNTWTKPTNASSVEVILIGGGGGGGGGGAKNGGAEKQGGGGGGGGAYASQVFLASDLASSVSVTIGSAGTSGGAVSGNGVDGGNGGVGGTTCFSSSSSCGGTMYVEAFGGGGGEGGGGVTPGKGAGSGGGGTAGAGSTSSTQTGSSGGLPGAAGANTNADGGNGGGGGSSGTTGGSPTAGSNGGAAEYGGAGGGGAPGANQTAGAGGSSLHGGGGGGAGASLNSGNASGSAAAGGVSQSNTAGGGGAAGSGACPGGAGTNGSSSSTSIKSGAGGGGGAANNGGGCTGGNGGSPGGGGGGGGSAGSGTSGAGGTGAVGAAWVISW